LKSNHLQTAFFERTILPHLDSGLNLAYSITRNRADAEDALQEASIKAYSGWRGLRGTDPRPWFLKIVRNECMNSLRRRNLAQNRELSLDEEIDGVRASWVDPAQEVLKNAARKDISKAIDGLSTSLRETLLLREIEGLTYQQIADVTNSPIGTVMSRLARARRALQTVLELGEPLT
jgi:RNA polymerase sigma-70 factor (ECF subfamily)